MSCVSVFSSEFCFFCLSVISSAYSCMWTFFSVLCFHRGSIIYLEFDYFFRVLLFLQTSISTVGLLSICIAFSFFFLSVLSSVLYCFYVSYYTYVLPAKKCPSKVFTSYLTIFFSSSLFLFSHPSYSFYLVSLSLSLSLSLSQASEMFLDKRTFSLSHTPHTHTDKNTHTHTHIQTNKHTYTNKHTHLHWLLPVTEVCKNWNYSAASYISHIPILILKQMNLLSWHIFWKQIEKSMTKLWKQWFGYTLHRETVCHLCKLPIPFDQKEAIIFG